MHKILSIYTIRIIPLCKHSEWGSSLALFSSFSIVHLVLSHLIPACLFFLAVLTQKIDNRSPNSLSPNSLSPTFLSPAFLSPNVLSLNDIHSSLYLFYNHSNLSHKKRYMLHRNSLLFNHIYISLYLFPSLQRHTSMQNKYMPLPTPSINCYSY